MRKVAALTAAMLALPGLPAFGDNTARDVPGWRIAGAGVGRPGAAAAACAACHAVDGGGIGGALPRIGAMDRAYLAQAMRAYADGSRANAVMGAVARAMTPQEIDAVSAWFASTNPVAFPTPPADAGAQALGQGIAEHGLPGTGVNACQTCHGDGQGAGVQYAVPYLQGQSAPYTRLQFESWWRGLRNDDPDQVMNAIAAKLDARQVAALAAYYEALLPPPPRPAETGPEMTQ